MPDMNRPPTARSVLLMMERWCCHNQPPSTAEGWPGKMGARESAGRYADIDINLIVPTSELCRAAFAHSCESPSTRRKICA